jgi:ATP-dependent protease ClpP protease subunit
MAKHRIDVRGSIIRNDYKWYFDFLGDECTCPQDVAKVLEQAADGDDVDVYISSPGGEIASGSEIYTMLREASARVNLKIHITGEACSAASVIACAGPSEMAPTALMMVHCVSTVAGGNHNDMEHTAEILKTADRALCTAYTAKSGMTEEEALDMMEHETWLTAQQAKDKGLVDEIMFEEAEAAPLVASSGLFRYPTKEQMDKVRAMMGKPEISDETTTIRQNREADLLRLTCRREATNR